MSRKRTLFLSMALLLVLSLASAAQAAAPTQAPVREAQGSKPVYDRQFIDFMVPHHESAIAMAEIALTRTTREEIRLMAQREIATQTEEIAQLRAWRDEWFGSPNTPPMTAIPIMPETPHRESGMVVMDMTIMIDKVRNAPDANFDLVFIDQMILHHMDAIEASLIERHHDGNEDIYNMARKIALEQHESALEMAELRDLWFFTPGGPVPTDTVNLTPTVWPTDAGGSVETMVPPTDTGNPVETLNPSPMP